MSTRAPSYLRQQSIQAVLQHAQQAGRAVGGWQHPPMTPFSGVRISWLITDRKLSFRCMAVLSSEIITKRWRCSVSAAAASFRSDTVTKLSYMMPELYSSCSSRWMCG